MKRLWHDYNLLWIMLIIFVVTAAIESVLSYHVTATQYRWHGEVLTMEAFWLGFFQNLTGRIAASVMVLIIFTVARAFFVYKGSPVSKDGPEERTALLQAIREELAGRREES